MKDIFRVLVRRKILQPNEESRLGRVLNAFDLTAMGVGSTLGVGVYVLTGQVAKESAGPAVIISFAIAAIASVFAGLCYAEFGARVPRAGSAYVYSYVCVGELIAFIIGWNLILEYVIGSASVARALSLYLDSLIDNVMQKAFIDFLPMHVEFLSPYVDFFAFGVPIVFAIALAFGMKESSVVNNIITLLNLAVVVFVIIAGGIKADPKNWSIDKADIPASADGGAGGFFPFGMAGVMKGAATCFYGFIGFDCIATSGEEVHSPQKSIPIAITVSLFIIFLSYFGVSTVLTLMLPYYLQSSNSSVPYAFGQVGWNVAKWIITIGGIFGLLASLFGAVFPLPRIIYAMANDGLLFKSLGRVSERFQTPVIGTLLAGLLTGILSAVFDLQQLVNMMSIGTLLAYTIVAACVLLLRYSLDPSGNNEPEYEQAASPLLGFPALDDSDASNTVLVDPSDKIEPANEQAPLPAVPELDDSDSSYMYTDDRLHRDEYLRSELESSTSNLIVCENKVTCSELLSQMFNSNKLATPTAVSSLLIKIEVFFFCLFAIGFGLCFLFGSKDIFAGVIWICILTAIMVAAMIFVLFSIYKQPKSSRPLDFKVPCVPLIPAISIVINIYLMLMLDVNTWIRFGVWMIIGLPIYLLCVTKYHRGERNLTITLDRRNLNGKMNYAYDNHLSIYHEEILPLPEESVTIIHHPIQNGINHTAEQPSEMKMETVQEIHKLEVLSELPENSDISDEIIPITCEEEPENQYDEIGLIEQTTNERSSAKSNDDEEKSSINVEEESEIIKVNHYYENVKKESVESRASETQAIAILDEVLSHEIEEGDEISPIVTIIPLEPHYRKISCDTESLNSIAPPIEHSALVHREDDVTSQCSESLNQIDENLQSRSIEITDLDEIQDTLPETLPHNEPFVPKTPNVSRVESFARPSLGVNKSTHTNAEDFVNKLNILLQEKLLEKPWKKGLVKPTNYDSDDENERKNSEDLRTPDVSGRIAKINEEILARSKVIESRKVSLEIQKKWKDVPTPESEETDDSDSGDRTDIRNRLEEIFKAGPQNPVEAHKTLRRIPPVKQGGIDVEISNKENTEDANNTSELALRLRNKKSDMASVEDKNVIPLNTSQVHSYTNVPRQVNRNNEEEPDMKTPTDIRNQLNQILAIGPLLPIQFPARTYPRRTTPEKIVAPSIMAEKAPELAPRSRTQSFSFIPPVPPLPPTDYTNATPPGVDPTQRVLMRSLLKSIEQKHRTGAIK